MSVDEQLDSGPTALPCESEAWATIALVGEIDIASAPAMLRAVLAAAAGDAGVVVDFTQVDFVGVAGLNALVRARHQLRSHGADLLVRSPPRLLARMLDILDLTDLIEPAPPATAAPGTEKDRLAG